MRVASSPIVWAILIVLASPLAAWAQPGYLGLVADDRETAGRGIQIREVVDGGPADLAGLREDDMILAINGRAIRRMDDLALVLQTSRASDVWNMDVQRSGRLQRVVMQLGRRPAEPNQQFGEIGRIEGPPTEAMPQPRGDMPQPRGEPPSDVAGLLGVSLSAIDEASRRRLNLPSTLGALVTEVLRGSPAEQAGMRPDDAIVAINNIVINRPSDLAERVAASITGDSVGVSFYRGGRFQNAKVPLTAVERPVAPPPPRANPPRVPQPAPRGDLPPPVDDPIGPPPPPSVARPPSPPPPPRANLPAGQDRIEQLEATVQALERRVRELEQQLNAPRREAPGDGPALPPPVEDEF
jgi:hypothetical protein